MLQAMINLPLNPHLHFLQYWGGGGGNHRIKLISQTEDSFVRAFILQVHV